MLHFANTIPFNLPKYKYFFNQKKLTLLANRLYAQLKNCCLCPRNCKINRQNNEIGFCRSSLRAKVYAYMAHFGEEPPISGQKGSGTIFFSNCNLRCIYCQNYRFSQEGEGREVEVEELGQMMLKLQEQGCHNLNLVTPTHYLPAIIQALILAVKKGLNIPIVYNTSGYENISTLNFLKNVVDIYLADMRYGGSEEAKIYSQAADYATVNQKAIKEMYNQAGNLVLDESGIAQRGLIIRHLVLPNQISRSSHILNFIAKHISSDAYVSLMSQYTPAYKADGYPLISRRITSLEYKSVIGLMHKFGLGNGWIQVINEFEPYFPDTGINLKPNNSLS